MALNVRRGTSAIAYVDGEAVKVLPESNVPGIKSRFITVGAELTGNQEQKRFTGDVDEIRIWHGLYSNSVLFDERFNMIDTTSVKGLVRYYPFEQIVLDGGNQPVTNLSQHNAAEKNDVTTHDIVGQLVKANTTPPLKAAPIRSNLYYTFTASDRKVAINIDDDAMRKLEGTTVNISLKNVPDVNGNYSNRISWNAYVRKNPLRWVERQKIDMATDEGVEKTFTEDIVNLGASTISWMLNMPSWLSASPSSGTIDPNGSIRVTFTVSANVPVGKVSESISLTNVATNMTERRDIDLRVAGDSPEWVVEKGDKEFSMPVTARLVVDGAYSEDEADLVAAFVENVCVGVSYVQYNKLRNSYYVSMNLYGDQNQLNKSVTFKAWDANRNVTYAPLTSSTPISFTANGMPVGNYDNPVILTSGQTVEQIVKLKEGWNWVSIFVNTKGQRLNDNLRLTNGKITAVKTQDRGVAWNAALDSRTGEPFGFMGDLESMNVNSMYALKAVEQILRAKARELPESVH